MALHLVWLWAAAAASLVSLGVHSLVGAPRILPPLAQSNLAPMPRNVLYFVWHIATIVLVAILASFVLAALYPAVWPLAVEATLICLAIAALILFVAISRRMRFADMPQWTLFLAVGVLGLLAIWP